jgi:CBS domain containing-hemolysin-like protein
LSCTLAARFLPFPQAYDVRFRFSFGEIIPQALCARYGLRIGAVAAPFVLALVGSLPQHLWSFADAASVSQMWIEFPIAWPIAKLLDYLLGKSHGTLYKKAELKTFVSLRECRSCELRVTNQLY